MRDVRHRLRQDAVAPLPGPLEIGELERVGDVDHAVHVLTIAHLAAGTYSPRFDRVRLTSLLSAALIKARSDAFFLVRGKELARSGCPVVGVVGVAPSFCSAVGWELGYLAVLPQWQGLGLGRLLVEEAVAFVLAQRPAPAFLLARAAQPALFEPMGFRQIDGGSPSLMLRSF